MTEKQASNLKVGISHVLLNGCIYLLTGKGSNTIAATETIYHLQQVERPHATRKATRKNMVRLKTYVLMVASNFPAYHPRAGQATDFAGAIKREEKIHTARSNYEKWLPKVKAIQEGRAALCVRSWSGKPYASKMIMHKQFTKWDGIGIEKAIWCPENGSIAISDKQVPLEIFAKKDGLSKPDLLAWFSKTKDGQALAVLHFTTYRYKWSICKECGCVGDLGRKIEKVDTTYSRVVEFIVCSNCANAQPNLSRQALLLKKQRTEAAKENLDKALNLSNFLTGKADELITE